jgi:5'-nucleotidase
MQALLVVGAVAVVLAAPLAPSSPATQDTVVISGARSLSDQVSVSYGGSHGSRTTDIHVLAFNDLHGNLEAAGNNIYGKFAGGAAYLSKAIKDRQALYGSRQATVFAGDNIGASPLANSLFHEEPITIASNLMHVDFAARPTSTRAPTSSTCRPTSPSTPPARPCSRPPAPSGSAPAAAARSRSASSARC